MRNIKKNRKIDLKVSKDDPEVAYLYLPAYFEIKAERDELGIVSKQVRLFDLMPNYKGPDIYLDFAEEDVLIGIEILS